MQRTKTSISILSLGFILAACSGTPGDQTGLAERVARAASRSVVDRIIEADERSGKHDPAEETVQPLALSASRPDAIIQPSLAPLLDSATDVNGRVGVSPVAAATALADVREACEEESAHPVEIETVRTNPVASVTACHLTRAKRGALTRS